MICDDCHHNEDAMLEKCPSCGSENVWWDRFKVTTGIVLSTVMLNCASSEPHKMMDQASPPKSYDEWTPPPPLIMDEDGFVKEEPYDKDPKKDKKLKKLIKSKKK